MNDRMKESLSALVDGEADELEIRRVLNQSEHDDNLREQWGRYQLIGSVMRGEPASTTDLSRGIMQALDGVPMDEVPASVSEESHNHQSMSAETNATPDANEQKSNRFSWVTSGAVAASVTLAVLLGARLTDAPEVTGAVTSPSVAATGASAVNPQSTAPVLSTLSQPGSQLVSVTSEQLPYSPIPSAGEPELSEAELREAQDKLRAYVMQHSEHAALNTGRGLMPFARVSNFDADEQQ